MNLNRDQFLADLTRDEGFRAYIYDDATGGRIVAGKTLSGRATLGVGWCPETNPCSEELGQIILTYHVDDVVKTLGMAAEWVKFLPEAGQRALCDMAYQVGVTGLMKFNTFMAMMQQGRYTEASADLKTTPWFKQSGQRALRIQALIESCNSEGATA